MPRTSTHKIETDARDYIRGRINRFYKNGDALFRELTERDYGVDAIIELFDDGAPTGRLSLVQIKGTQDSIVPLKRTPVVACSISASNACYAFQSNIPVMLIYVSTTKPAGFYFVDLHLAVSEIERKKLEDQKSIAIHIPIQNNAQEDLSPFFAAINAYYSR